MTEAVCTCDLEKVNGAGVAVLDCVDDSAKDAVAMTGNRLLDKLSVDLREELLALCKRVELPAGTVLYEPGEMPRYAEFLCSGVASAAVGASDGRIAEVGIIGSEGVVGAMEVLGPEPGPTHCSIQIEARALRMGFEEFRWQFRRSEELRNRVLEFVQLQALTLAQLAACNRLHGAEQRLARWLLMRRDRTGSNVVPTTHEMLSLVLGTRRPAITLCAAELKRKGLIDGRRGEVRIVFAEGLEKVACQCYPVTRNSLAALYQ